MTLTLGSSATSVGSQRAAPRSGICIVLHDLRGGGAERACLRLARGMIAAGRRVELVLVRGEGAYLTDVPSGIDLTILDCPRVSNALWPLLAHFRRTRPRAILSALTHMNLATIAAARLSGHRTRVVVSERNQISAKARAAVGLRQRIVYQAVPWLYATADAIIAVSEGVARDLRSFGQFSPHKVSVVHNPVFDPDIAELARQEPLHPWLLAGDPPIILAAGRLHPQKGFDVLLRAFARVRAQIDCRLVILGEGAERASLAAMASDIGLAYDVDFPGFARNPFSLMARAAVFVLSSRWEGFPNALVEAMASGVPVVSTDCPSGPREILDHGRYGRLVPPGSAELLADAILAVLRERPDTTASRRRAEMFSVAAATRQYLDLLEAAP